MKEKERKRRTTYSFLSKKFTPTNKTIQKGVLDSWRMKEREREREGKQQLTTLSLTHVSRVYLQDVARERNEGRPALIFTFIRGLRSRQSIADCIVCSIQSNSITPLVVDVDYLFSRTIVRYLSEDTRLSLSLSFLPRTIFVHLLWISILKKKSWSRTNVRIIEFVGEIEFKWNSELNRNNKLYFVFRL